MANYLSKVNLHLIQLQEARNTMDPYAIQWLLRFLFLTKTETRCDKYKGYLPLCFDLTVLCYGNCLYWRISRKILLRQGSNLRKLNIFF